MSNRTMPRRRTRKQGLLTRAGASEPVGKGRRRPRSGSARRRGIASVLAMMFMVMFGSLAVAMAIVSKGNLRTAQTHIHVMRAMGAAETGLEIAAARLAEATGRFVISKGTVDGNFATDLWMGTVSDEDSELLVLPPTTGYPEFTEPAGIAEALMNSFAADQNTVEIPGAPTQPEMHSAPAGTDGSVYLAAGWLSMPPVAIDADGSDDSARPASFQVTYAPLANGTDIRIIVTGYSSMSSVGASNYHYGRTGDEVRPLVRVIQRDFRILKQHAHAMVSPSRIMIGKNVQINGNVGARYDNVSVNNGHPIVMRTDFRGLDPVLDAKLDALYAGVEDADIDGDNRLRAGHAVEGEGIGAPEDFDGDGAAEDAMADATADGFVDELDVFINHYDANGDGRVVLAASLTQGTPAQGLTPEFTDDDDLALLIDSAYPDRNRNGVYGFDDANNNGRWDHDEAMLDLDPVHGTNADQVLGYRDGVIDRKDRYAKVRGGLKFSVSEQDWSDAQGTYQQYVRGVIAPVEDHDSPVVFNAGDREMPVLTADMFANAGNALKELSDGLSFEQQVATQLGIAVGDLATYTEASNDENSPRYWRADLDDAYVYARTSRHIYERMPFNAPAFVDWYYRPRYENMVFKDAEIPRGTNALFINCTFVGVTYIRSYTDNTHVNWTNYGRMQWSEAEGHPIFDTNPFDKSDFARYYTGNPADGPENYDEFPDPPVIDGQVRTGEERNTKLYSNNIRFHNCLFIGSVVSDTPNGYTQVRNKMQFTGGTRFQTQHPDEPNDPDLNPDPEDLDEILKSSLLLPNYSVDIGSFNSPTDTFEGGPTPQNVRLQGTIVAGVLDIRGNTTVDGTLLLTFAPVLGEGPLVDPQGNPIGNPAGFNATLGYFGAEDGDDEALDPETLPIVDGQRIVGWDLDGDGIADLGPADAPSEEELAGGATAIPFYGYGRIIINWRPDLPMPDGIMLPAAASPVPNSYREGRHP